ncbi:heavy-metal-associated domain-containing protein [Kineosporia rhizophila]|uniref:heavy-metal-associated domain-containing protein n=1 Tax=Kineosporia rhizophila TaxID=84633 RepID=UPI001E2F1A3F|nr:heavy-metal-associated domain-containing protein [Kineosporia rhizophila]MCE0536092.1 heavy-metal-associated domain-containing protein [Kineosporia rhizophila]
MSLAGRFGLYAAGLVAAFAAAFGIAALVVPENAVDSWQDKADPDQGDSHGGDQTQAPTGGQASASTAVAGLSLSQDGYTLGAISAPGQAGEKGTLRFTVLDAKGLPLTAFETSHDKDLHLIVVRNDGTGFRHVHPALDPATGAWSIPWQWAQAGTYSVLTDFVPAMPGAPDKVAVRRTFDVAGSFTPQPSPVATRTVHVDGFDVAVTGDLAVGTSRTLTMTVSRDGEPVTALEPYLGAYGHLVALREGDLAYLHVHAEGEAPEPKSTTGPDISFAAQAPTGGRYLFYLDFQVDGRVHTAQFVLDVPSKDDDRGQVTDAEPPSGGKSPDYDGTHTDEGHGH